MSSGISRWDIFSQIPERRVCGLFEIAEESSMNTDAGTFADWLVEVRKALDSINMSMETWHAVWPTFLRR